ncbi:MAG: endonuclease V [Pirellulales bacterium]|nr:endonuclease V [Pirellulales bacterium]
MSIAAQTLSNDIAELLPPLPNMVGEMARLLGQVPSGCVTTYGALATALGDVKAARWVGHYLLHHAHNELCVCHRVVRAGGALGGYIAGGTKAKIAALGAESVLTDGDRVDLERYEWRRLMGKRPLARLRQAQHNAAEHVTITTPASLPDAVAGVDVSYSADGHGVGVYALTEYPSGKLVWWTSRRLPVTFPYIQSFLTFRELPILLALVDEARQAGKLADALLVDGAGVAHQRQIGLASHFGVVTNLRTIGVTKRLLWGQLATDKKPRCGAIPIMLQDRTIGVALKASRDSEQTLYASPGHLVDVEYARQVTRTLLKGRRLPEPIYWADRLSRMLARGGDPPQTIAALRDSAATKRRRSK